MSRQEILITRYGEMMDLITCLDIYEGRANYKAPKKKYTFLEAIKLK